MSEKRSAAQRATRILIALVILSTTILLTGCPLLSEAKGKVLSDSAESDVGLIDGEPDYGIRITVVIKNVGKSGSIKITPLLSCDEGEWDRTQNLNFSAGETKTLTYFFSEPTVNATNCHYGVGVWPKVSE